MFKALFYPREVKSYTDNVRASVTDSMSASKTELLACFWSSKNTKVLLLKVLNSLIKPKFSKNLHTFVLSISMVSIPLQK